MSDFRNTETKNVQEETADQENQAGASVKEPSAKEMKKELKKEGKELTDFEAGIRSGYLQAQSDHAGMYKYKKALDEGKSKKEAREISQVRGKK